MAKTNKPRRMDRYFKNLQRNSYILSYNKKGSCTTKIKKWDVIRRLTKKIGSEDEQTAKVPKEPRSFDSGVQLLPRQDVMLYGTIPAMEQRVYSKCKNCTRVFNPRDILSHRSCSKSHTLHSSLLKKKVKSKSSNGKKTSSNGTPSSNSTNSNSSVVATSSTSPVDPLKDFEFKRPYTPPPIKAAAAAPAPSMPQLKVSVTKIGISKSAKSTPVTTSPSISTSTSSSDKSDSKVSSSKVSTSVHHSPKSPSSSGHHSSKSSSGHSPRSPLSSSSSGHHGPKSPSSSHHSPKSPSSSSHHRSKSPSSSAPYNPRSPSKSSSSSSHHGSSHHTSSHHSSKSSSKSTPMDTLPASSSSSHHHHSSSSSSSHSSSRHKKSSSSSSKRSSSSSSSSSSGSSSSSSSSAKIFPKNYDPDIHCGVIEGNRRPCMRSITCSNHRLHLRKQVSGRSKDIHQLISERKAAKENDLKHTTPPCSYTSPNGEAKEILSPNTSYVPVVGQAVNTAGDTSVTNSFVPLSKGQTRLSTVLGKKSSGGESVNESAKTLTSGYMFRSKNIENTQDSVVGTVPVVIMPVSPMSVVSSVQLLTIGNNIISLESPQSASNSPSKKQVILPIPSNHTNGIRMYKSHPKPLILPNFGARKLGGAILLANPLLEDQRNDLLTTIDHRDVNGFILHADVSKTTDAPQYTGENGPSQHELIISLIDKYGF